MALDLDAWIHTSCVTLDKSLNLSVPQLLIYKRDMTLAPIPHLLKWQYKITVTAWALTPTTWTKMLALSPAHCGASHSSLW